MNLITATVTAIALTLAPFSGAIAQSTNPSLPPNATCSFSIYTREESAPILADEPCRARISVIGDVSVYLSVFGVLWNDRQEYAPTTMFWSSDAFSSWTTATDAKAMTTSDSVHCVMGDLNNGDGKAKIGVFICFRMNPAP